MSEDTKIGTTSGLTSEDKVGDVYYVAGVDDDFGVYLEEWHVRSVRSKDTGIVIKKVETVVSAVRKVERVTWVRVPESFEWTWAKNIDSWNRATWIQGQRPKTYHATKAGAYGDAIGLLKKALGKGKRALGTLEKRYGKEKTAKKTRTVKKVPKPKTVWPHLHGLFVFANSLTNPLTKADIGREVYYEDDKTVSLVGTSRVGRLHELEGTVCTVWLG